MKTMTERRSKRRLMQGNEACAEGAIAAGVRFFAGYPITPATEIAEIMARRLPQVDGIFIQMEDEIGSLCAVLGASVAGGKAMTASSGPGISLMQESIGLAMITEIPCVVVNVMRGGPSTGMPTYPSQMDVMQARWGTHGDHPVIALAPSSVRESFDLTVEAVNLSERFRTPVFVLSDAAVGHLREVVELPEADEIELESRLRPQVSPEDYVPYAGRDGQVPPMADFGTGYRWHVDSNVHDEYGFPATSSPSTADSLVRRLNAKVLDRADEIVRTEAYHLDDAEVAIIAYGSVARSAAEAVDMARDRGKRIGLLRPITLWPFPEAAIQELASRVRSILVPEMNLGQMTHEVERLACGQAEVRPLNRIDGLSITPGEIIDALKEMV
jgi:2-oxoglutarate ferredoxin oxidoreductase subunit alpha